MKSFVEIVQAKEAEETGLMRRPGVTGVDVGYKYVHGKRTDEICIRVMVKDKQDQPRGLTIPKTLRGIKTDVIERTFVLHRTASRVKVQDIELMSDAGRYDPIKGGISIGPCRSVGGYVHAGTLGCVVKDNTSGETLLLSNFHVMCVDNGWHVGDEICQPSRVDRGRGPADRIGTLLRAVLDSSTDAAVCTLSGRASACEIVAIGNVAGTATAVLGMPVRKQGRTTGMTYGTVDSLSLTINVDYGDGLGVKTLSNQISIAPDRKHNAQFGDHGDSGSVVVNDGREIIGLHFAGSDDGYGIANPIAAVLSDLNISICVANEPKPVIQDVRVTPAKRSSAP